MTTWIENEKEWLKEENDLLCESIEIKFKGNKVKFRFFFDEGTTGAWNTVDKKEFLEFIEWAEGAIHSTIRSHYFETRR